MKGSKTTQQQTSQSTQTANPFAPAEPLLNQILSQAGRLARQPALSSQAQGALTGLSNLDVGFDAEREGLISDLFAGGGFGEGANLVRNALDTSRSYYGGILDTGFDPQKDQVLNDALQRVQNDAINQVGSRFALAGRSFSPSAARAASEGVADVTARALLGERARVQDRQDQAARALFSGDLAGAGFLDNANAQELGARQAGFGLLDDNFNLNALPYENTLRAEEIRRNAPLQQLGVLSDLVLPIASGFGTRTNQGTGTTTANRQTDPLQLALGAGIGGLGLLGGFGTPAVASRGFNALAGGVGTGRSATGTLSF